MKYYKNSNELIEHLISNGVFVSDKEDAINKINKYSYYSIINSYKRVFKTSSGVYKKNVSFDEIYTLYEFDKNIRFIFLKYILEIEIIIKSLLAEVISKKYGIENYLMVNNFDSNIDNSITEKSINKIKREIEKQNGKHEALTHYINKYGFVPPFVLVKILTFGELSRLYIMLKQPDKQMVSKVFKISDKLLGQIMKNLAMVRNICAHNDRLFSFHSKFLLTFKDIDKNYANKSNSTNLYMIFKSMKVLLGEDESLEFEKLINIEMNILKNNIKSINIDIVFYLMGFYKDK